MAGKEKTIIVYDDFSSDAPIILDESEVERYGYLGEAKYLKL